MRSNLEHWRKLQERRYFEHHKYFRPGRDGKADVERIEQFVELKPEHTVVVIGCGYGRECADICKRVSKVYGIDVSEVILDKAVKYLGERGIRNFVPVAADQYGNEIPNGIDVVYSIVTMQHITRDLVRDYLQRLGAKLSPDGCMVIQFIETIHGEQDAALRVYEPQVSWTPDQISEAASGLRVVERKVVEGENWTHHWVHLIRS